MVDEINAALSDEFDSVVTDGISQDPLMTSSDERLRSACAVRQRRSSRGQGFVSGLLGLASLLSHFKPSLQKVGTRNIWIAP